MILIQLVADSTIASMSEEKLKTKAAIVYKRRKATLHGDI